MANEKLPTHDDYDRFLDFVRTYHGEYILDKQRNEEEPLPLFEYLNTHFFWLVQQYKDSQNLLKHN
jgi:hypothetical protein